MNTRVANAILVLWLFFSAFLWHQTYNQRVLGWIVGMLAVTAALVERPHRRFGREMTLVLGGILIVVALLQTPRTRATFWNTLLVGLAMVLFSIISHLRALRSHGAAEV
jgi:uncharacterized membrane protein YobD (UPF0266 family)